MQNWITNNSTLFFGLVLAITLIIIIITAVHSAKKKAVKKQLLQSNKNLVEIVFDYFVAPPSPVGGVMGRSVGFTIYSVNGQPPQIFGNSVLVSVGEVVLDYEYCFQTVGKSFATSFGRSTYAFTAIPNHKYLFSYSELEKTLNYKEKKLKENS